MLAASRGGGNKSKRGLSGLFKIFLKNLLFRSSWSACKDKMRCMWHVCGRLLLPVVPRRAVGSGAGRGLYSWREQTVLVRVQSDNEGQAGEWLLVSCSYRVLLYDNSPKRTVYTSVQYHWMLSNSAIGTIPLFTLQQLLHQSLWIICIRGWLHARGVWEEINVKQLVKPF